MTDWREDKRWSDKFLPQIKRILGECLITEPPIEEDIERNTDLIVLRLDSVRIACRVRKHKYLARYGNEFTVRAGRPSGAKTELTKIIEGFGDYFFYGFADENETELAKWLIGDLRAFRIYFQRETVRMKGILPGTAKGNVDRSSHFRSFDYRQIPGFVIASA